jgi:radical SAM superfamily enzyme YgiQ (UPF0313 family)
MRITFIRPNFSNTRSSDALEPLVFAVLASMTPPEHELVLFDERIEPIDLQHETDLVAMTVETFTAKRAYEIAYHFRKRNIPVVMGGYHPTLFPEEARNYSDAIVVGDAEGQWTQVLLDIENQALKPLYNKTSLPEIDRRIPDRDIFKDKRYNKLLPVEYGRGCRYACDYCSIHSFYKSNLIQRPIDKVVEEIKTLDSKRILFVDDNLFKDPLTTKEFLLAIKPLKIKWVGQVSLDIASNPELLDLTAESGCIMLHIGFESLLENNLVDMKKSWNLKHGDYTSIIQKIQNRGIMIYGSFMLGYDHDTKASFDSTVDFAIKHKFCLTNINILNPIPGTKLYHRLERENRLIYDRWWLEMLSGQDKV